jgi:hypothetical protein
VGEIWLEPETKVNDCKMHGSVKYILQALVEPESQGQ